jgi:hypothetical protein
LFIDYVSNLHIFQYLFGELFYDWIDVPRIGKTVVYHYIIKKKEQTHTTISYKKTRPRPIEVRRDTMLVIVILIFCLPSDKIFGMSR